MAGVSLEHEVSHLHMPCVYTLSNLCPVLKEEAFSCCVTLQTSVYCDLFVRSLVQSEHVRAACIKLGV
jgi:hypothetical protein